MTLKEIKNTIIRGEKALVFPLKIHSGRVTDSEGNHVLDIRGWGHLQYADNNKGEEIQDSIGDWVVNTLNEENERISNR